MKRENAVPQGQVERERRRLEVLYEVSRRLAAVHDADEVLSLIVTEAARLLGVEAAALRLLAGEDLVLRAQTKSAVPLMARARLKVGESLSGVVVATGEPVSVEDLAKDARYDSMHKRAALAEGFRGFLGVPLRAGDQTIGVLLVYSKGRHHFLPDEISLLSAFADQASLAIEKARLLQEAEEGRKVASKLHEITGQLASSLDVNRVLDLITAKTLDLLGCDASGIYVYNDAKGGLTFLRGLHLDAELTRGLVLRPGDGVAGRAFQDRRPVWTNDRLADPSLRYDQDAERLVKAKAPRAYLAVPIVGQEEVLGVLMDYYFKPHDFTPKEVRLLSTLADNAAIAIKNSRLYEETRDALARVKRLQGLLPICAWCKKVRNDQNYWQGVEGYIAEHTDARFSHGICPDCKERLRKP